MIPTDPVSDAIVEAQAAPDSFTTDESPTNELGERRFVHKLGWFGPVSLLLVISWTLITTASATLIALKFTATLSPSRANSAIGLVNVFGALTGAIFAMFVGSLSDHTRSRLGRRNPWLIGGAIVSVIGLIALSTADFASVWQPIVFYCIYQAGLNTMGSAYTALLPDRIHSQLLGKASAWGGMGSLAGNAIGAIIASLLVNVLGAGNISGAFVFLPWFMAIMVTVLVLALPGAKMDRTTATEGLPESHGILDGFTTFRLPNDGQFWYAYFARFAFVMGLMLVLQTATQILRSTSASTSRRPPMWAPSPACCWPLSASSPRPSPDRSRTGWDAARDSSWLRPASSAWASRCWPPSRRS